MLLKVPNDIQMCCSWIQGQSSVSLTDTHLFSLKFFTPPPPSDRRKCREKGVALRAQTQWQQSWLVKSISSVRTRSTTTRLRARSMSLAVISPTTMTTTTMSLCWATSRNSTCNATNFSNRWQRSSWKSKQSGAVKRQLERRLNWWIFWEHNENTKHTALLPFIFCVWWLDTSCLALVFMISLFAIYWVCRFRDIWAVATSNFCFAHLSLEPDPIARFPTRVIILISAQHRKKPKTAVFAHILTPLPVYRARDWRRYRGMTPFVCFDFVSL